MSSWVLVGLRGCEGNPFAQRKDDVHRLSGPVTPWTVGSMSDTDIDIDLAGHLVVGTDGSDPSFNAVRWAAAEAHRRNAPLHIVHAREGQVSMMTVSPSDVAAQLQAVDEQSASVLERALAVARSGPAPASITTSQAMGNPARLLIEASRQARLVVVGASGGGRIRAALFGSTPLQLAIHATCPVAIIAPHHQHHGTGNPHVVVGLDSASTSYAATELAFRVAQPDGKVTLAHAVTLEDLELAPTDPAAGSSVPREAALEDTEYGRSAPLLDERVHDLINKFPQVSVDTVRARGDAADVLINVARRADILSVATRGQGGFTGLLLGSVAQRIMQVSPVPLFVVQQDWTADETAVWLQ